MPAMYPEELRRLREQNPGLQYDFRGDIIGLANPGDYTYQSDAWAYGPTRLDYQNSRDFVGPLQPGQQLGGLMQGADGYNYRNDQFVGPVMPGQTQGYTYSDYDQAGPLQPGMSMETLGGEQFGPSLPGMPRPGQHLNLSEPSVGFYSQWNPDTNSWVRHGSPSGGGGFSVPRPRRQQSQSPSQLPEDLQYGLI